MKSLLSLVAVLFSTAVLAGPYSALEGVPAELCPDIKIDYKNDIGTCKASNAKVVLAAKTGAKITTEEYRKIKFEVYGPIELGIIPDADSNSAYFYTNWLVDTAGKKVGIKTISGWYNSEMEASGRVDVRYNLKGEIVKIELKDI